MEGAYTIEGVEDKNIDNEITIDISFPKEIIDKIKLFKKKVKSLEAKLLYYEQQRNKVKSLKLTKENRSKYATFFRTKRAWYVKERDFFLRRLSYHIKLSNKFLLNDNTLLEGKEYIIYTYFKYTTSRCFNCATTRHKKYNCKTYVPYSRNEPDDIDIPELEK